MKPLYLLLLIIFLFPVSIFAQVDSNRTHQDSVTKEIVKKDSSRPKPVVPKIRHTIKIADTVFVVPIDSLQVKDSLRVQDSLKLLRQHIADSIQRKLEQEKRLQAQNIKDGEKKTFVGKEWLFYYLVLLLILFGLLRRVFAKYLDRKSVV